MELNGIEWNCMELHGIAWSCMGLRGLAWNLTELIATAWNCREFILFYDNYDFNLTIWRQLPAFEKHSHLRRRLISISGTDILKLPPRVARKGMQTTSGQNEIMQNLIQSFGKRGLNKRKYFSVNLARFFSSSVYEFEKISNKE